MRSRGKRTASGSGVVSACVEARTVLRLQVRRAGRGTTEVPDQSVVGRSVIWVAVRGWTGESMATSQYFAWRFAL
jgi:hypothetical protein